MEFDKTLNQLQKRLPQGEIALEDICSLTERKSRLVDILIQLQGRISRNRADWMELQEAHQRLNQLVVKLENGLVRNQPDYPATLRGRKLKHLTDFVETMRQKESNYLKLLDGLKTDHQIEVNLSEVRRIATNLGREGFTLPKVEPERFDKALSSIEDALLNQQRIAQHAESLAAVFANLKCFIEAFTSKIDEITSAKDSRVPVELLEEASRLLGEFNQERERVTSEVLGITETLKASFLPRRQLPQALLSIPEALEDSFNNAIQGIERISQEIGDKVAKAQNLKESLEHGITELEEVRRQCSKFMEDLDVVATQDEITYLQTGVQGAVSKVSLVSGLLKKARSQASKIGVCGDLVAEASRTQTDVEATLEKLKTSLKTLQARLDKCTKCVAVAKEALVTNTHAVKQAVHFRLPVRTVSELEERLESLRNHQSEARAIEDALNGSSCADYIKPKLNLLPAVLHHVEEVMKQSKGLPEAITDGFFAQIRQVLEDYEASLLNATSSMEETVQAASCWMAESDALLSEHKEVYEQLEAVAETVPPCDTSDSSLGPSARLLGLQKVKEMEHSWRQDQLRNVENLDRDVSSGSASFNLKSIDEVRRRIEDMRGGLSKVKIALGKAVMLWEARVSAERELKQLLGMADSTFNRVFEELDNIETQYRFCSTPAAEEMMSRLNVLSGQVSVGDELAAKIRSLVDGDDPIILTKWETASRTQLPALLAGVDAVIAERTGKEKELMALQSWLNDFQRVVQEVSISGEASTFQLGDGVLSRVDDLSNQLSAWESGHLNSYVLKTKSKERLEPLFKQKESIQCRLRSLRSLAQERALAQQKLEDRVGELFAELGVFCEGLAVLSSVSGVSSIQEACATLRSILEQIRGPRGQMLESLFTKKCSLEGDVVSYPGLVPRVQTLHKRLETSRANQVEMESKIAGQLAHLEEVAAAASRMDQWIRECSEIRLADFDKGEPFDVKDSGRIDSEDAHQNMRKLDTVIDGRQRELSRVKKASFNAEIGKGLLEELARKTTSLNGDYVQLGSGLLDTYKSRYRLIEEGLSSKVKSAQDTVDRAIKIRTVVSKIDVLASECGETDSMDTWNAKIESIVDLSTGELQSLTKDDSALCGQSGRVEAMVRSLKSQLHQREMLNRAAAIKRDALRTQLQNLQEWLSLWSNDLEEVKRTAELELGLLITSISPPTVRVFQSMENLTPLIQQLLAKQKDFEDSVEQSRAADLDDVISGLSNEFKSAARRGTRTSAQFTEMHARAELLRANLQQARGWINDVSKGLAMLKVSGFYF